MSLEVLVSTMNQNNYNLLEQMRINSEAVIINQNKSDTKDTLYFKNKKILWINSKSRGLSVSRNKAIQNSTSEICVIADDDLEYVDSYQDIILDCFEKNPEHDIITFQVEGIGKKFKEYHPTARKLNYFTTMKVSSVEIAFRSKSIKDAGVRFNETFGSGTKYLAGEEIIFLYDCLRKGLSIKYIPVKIADLHLGNSSWFSGFNEEYFFAKGAIFTGMSKKHSILLIFQFAIRKHNLYSDLISINKAIRYMFKGRREYLNTLYTQSE